MKTPYDENDEIRAQVEREMPWPKGGFEDFEDECDFKEDREARFMELVHNYPNGLP